MATKHGKGVTCNVVFPSVTLHDPLIKGSGDLDFFYMICKFKTQTPKLSPTFC